LFIFHKSRVVWSDHQTAALTGLWTSPCHRWFRCIWSEYKTMMKMVRSLSLHSSSISKSLAQETRWRLDSFTPVIIFTSRHGWTKSSLSWLGTKVLRLDSFIF
jgi:hypothetical protein